MKIIIAITTVLVAAQLVGVVILAHNVARRERNSQSAGLFGILVVHVLCFGGAFLISIAVGCAAVLAAAVAMVAMALSMAASRHLAGYRTAGTVVVVTTVLLSVLSIVSTVVFMEYLATVGVSASTIALMSIGAVFAVVFLPVDLLGGIMRSEVLQRSRWRRTGHTVRKRRPGYAPMVSVQVPTHAEPPEVVIRTVDALSRLDYPNYEVVVIDNNTTEESLWRPVEEHCERLGPQFRFLHVEGITGAKAGALNWARPYIHPTAELIGVVDADYVADPDWLAHTVGYFEDPAMGFVQCPHAYRDYESSAFTRMANAEYAPFFATEMVGLDEYGAGITVGTMSVIRLAALDQAGGWAEWCMTEDSELAIRIHACGYTSVYIERPYGRGLIPDTWDGYRKQRFRWTYGPVQEFLTHRRLFGFGSGRTPSRLDLVQRIFHGHHGLNIALVGIRFAVGAVLGPAILLSMIVHGETWPMPTSWLAPFPLALASQQVRRWVVYRKIMGFTIGDFLGSTVAQRALTYVMAAAALAALLGRPLLWQRTDKFRRPQPRSQALRGAGAEAVAAALCLSLAGISLMTLPLDLVTATMATGFAAYASAFAAAPALSYLSQRQARRKNSRLDESRAQSITGTKAA